MSARETTHPCGWKRGKASHQWERLHTIVDGREAGLAVSERDLIPMWMEERQGLSSEK
jgi:hypothetical protein